jgi:CubicO group peptidase (beta-lactamase class C family)
MTDKIFFLIITVCTVIFVIFFAIFIKKTGIYNSTNIQKNSHPSQNEYQNHENKNLQLKKSVNGKSGHSKFFPDKIWDVSVPEKQGMDSEVLLDMYKKYNDDGIILIIKNGYLVSNYNQEYLNKDLHHIFSCTKSIISSLIGIARIEGYIKNVDQKVLSFFPDNKVNNLDDRKKNLTLYHLLTMTSGFEWYDSPDDIDSVNMSLTNDWAGYVLNKPMLSEPGKEWYYNSGCSQLLSIILTKTTGVSAYDYAKKKIFDPLGITNVQWEKDPQGNSTGGWGLYLTSFDLAKIGYLYLREGKWKDKQIVPKEWVLDSTRNHFTLGTSYDNNLNGFVYGFQWWIYTDLPYQAYKAWGAYETEAVEIIIIPDLDLDIVLTGNISSDEYLLKSYIIPSVKSSKALLPNIKTNIELNSILEKYN